MRGGSRREKRGRGGCGGPSRGEEEPAWQKGCPTRGRPGPMALGAPTPPGEGKPYRSVFAQLAECREGLLVRFAHLLDELPHLWCQRVALRALGLGRLLLLLVPVIPHSCGGQRPVVREGRCSQPSTLSPSSSHQSCRFRQRLSPGGHTRRVMHDDMHAHTNVHTDKCMSRQASTRGPPLHALSDPHTKSCHRAPGAQHRPTVPVLPRACSSPHSRCTGVP